MTDPRYTLRSIAIAGVTPVTRSTLGKMRSLFKLVVLVALTASLMGAIQAIGATSTKHKPAAVPTHRAFKAQVNDDGSPARPQVLTLIGEPRTVSTDPDWAGTDWEDNGMDSVELTCPAGRTAISGGFQAPDSAGVLLNGSHPGSTRDRWVVEVTYFGDGAPAQWIPNVTCL